MGEVSGQKSEWTKVRVVKCQYRSGQVKTGLDWLRQARTGLDRSGQVESEHVLTQITKKVLHELAQENRIALLSRLKKRKKTLPELIQETRNVLTELAQETKKV